MKNTIAKKLIIESQEAGQKEMQIRRTNTGIAGSIATKVSNRSTFDEKRNTFFSIDEQADLLAERLTDEEVKYANQVWG
jgi:hypothetical protein